MPASALRLGSMLLVPSLVFVTVTMGSTTTIYPGEDWEDRINNPMSVGMSKPEIDAAFDHIFTNSDWPQGVVVIKNGVIVGERYRGNTGLFDKAFVGRDKHSIATSNSAAKSFTSALVGIALEKGLIKSIDEPVANYIPEWSSDRRSDVTIKNILEMASGLDSACSRRWDALLQPYRNGWPTAFMDQDGGSFNACAKDRACAGSGCPGSWRYERTDTQLVGVVLQAATGETVDDFAEKHLFSKIGIKNHSWWRDTHGNTAVFGCIDMTTRDFARFGLLFARKGKWKDVQVIPHEWVTRSTRPGAAPHYAMQWWIEADGRYCAYGLWSNYICVYPELDLVTVTNSFYQRIRIKWDGGKMKFDGYNGDTLWDGYNMITGRPSTIHEEPFYSTLLKAVECGGPNRAALPEGYCMRSTTVDKASAGQVRAEEDTAGSASSDGSSRPTTSGADQSTATYNLLKATSAALLGIVAAAASARGGLVV